jgi:hypothetical protein
MTVLRFPTRSPGGKFIDRLASDSDLRNKLRRLLANWRAKSLDN